jgi:SpoVK/Ycf46/Vps4 family AAA+-type ATPase
MEPTITAERDGSEATVAAENSGIRRLPDWFNPGVIRTPAELAAVETNLVILESTQVDSEAVTGDTESNTLDSDEASTSTSEASKKSETKKFEITPNLFSELRDVVSAAMIPNSKGELYKSETGTLVTYPEGSLEFCQQVLLQLAKDMGTSLIMLELEDLEDFAELFDALEYGPDGNSNSSFGNPDRKKTFELVKYYFGVRSERHAAESDYERSQKAIAFMLDFLGDKSPDQLEGVSGTLATSQPILVYLYGEKEMDDLNRAYRVYRRIWEAIASKRQKGEQVAFIVSAPEDQGKYASCSCCLPSRCVTKLKHKIHVGAGRTVILPNGHADVDSFHSSETDADFRNGTRNLRHLKRMLRRQMQQKSDRHLDWVQMQLFNGIKVPDVAKITWTDDDIQRATTQIAGRSWANPKLDYNDVRQVLERLCLYGTPTAEAEPEADAKDDSSRSSENSGLTTPSDSIIDSPSTGETSDAELEVTPSIDEIKEYNEGPNAWPIDESMAKKEWEEQKQSSAETNGALDDLMGMIGLESVKRKFMEIKHLMDTSRRQEVKISEQYFGCVLIGNPGTGKTTVARLYARLLSSLNIVPGPKFETTTGTKLFNGGIAACEKVIGRFESDEGGVIFVDDAHHLVNSDGSSCDVLNYITSEIDRLRGKVVFIFAGYPKPMESFLGSVPGLQSRIPFIINFDSYQDAELHQIFVDLLKKKFGGKMQVENGLNGLYVRVLIRRISRARVRASFANARQVQNSLHAIAIRQAKRLASSRRRLKDEDDMFLTKADLLGPPPSTALQDSEAWEKLQAMIGLASVKEEIQVFVNQLQVNYNRELAEQPLIECSLNKVFLGNPGTGKTTVAKYYGQILADIGLLSKGEIMAKTPADFIGSHLGQSEQNTKAILAAALGKVLIIDEAYGLSGAADDGNTAHTDNPYKSAVVDAIVGEVQSTASEDRCVLLLGYKDRMETMFQSVNPALGRRFPLSSAFDFADYTEEEMREILDRMLQVQGFTASDRAKKVAMEVLSRARHHRNYGNAGEVNILLDQAKMRQQKRLQGNAEGDELLLLEPQDFDPDFNRVERSEASIRTLMQDFVGADALIDKMEGYKRIVKNAKARDLDPRCHLPFTFLFRGPPGKRQYYITDVKKLLTICQARGRLPWLKGWAKSSTTWAC